MKYDKKNEKEIVLIVNEMHHNIQDDYHSKNKIMHDLEKKNWEKIFEKNNFNKKKILEIGTGTGFLPKLFIEREINFSSYTCTDISKNILLEAKERIQKINILNMSFDFIKLDDQNLPFKDNSYDFLIMNSVLHHLPDRKKFFFEASRVLNDNGVLIIGHEPNKFFHENFILKNIFLFFSNFLFILGKIKEIVNKKKIINKENMVNEINIYLKKKKLIKKDLNKIEINKLIDFGATKGINYLDTYDRFELRDFYNYCYLNTLNFAYNFFLWKIFVKMYDFFFSKIFKNRGGIYFGVYTKKKNK